MKNLLPLPTSIHILPLPIISPLFPALSYVHHPHPAYHLIPANTRLCRPTAQNCWANPRRSALKPYLAQPHQIVGKYMHKVEVSHKVSIMEVTSAPLGVRTRAGSLALQRLKKQRTQWEDKEGADGDYLELRSRRIKKLQLLVPIQKMRRGRKAAAMTTAAQEEVRGHSARTFSSWKAWIGEF